MGVGGIGRKQSESQISLGISLAAPSQAISKSNQFQVKTRKRTSKIFDKRLTESNYKDPY